jgi:hypothetical protein
VLAGATDAAQAAPTGRGVLQTTMAQPPSGRPPPTSVRFAASTLAAPPEPIPPGLR